MDRLLRFREPATWIAILIVVIEFATSVVRMVLSISGGTSVVETFRQTSSLVNLLTAFALTALVLSGLILSPVVARGRLLARVSAVLIGLAAVGGLVLLVGALLGGPGLWGAVFEIVGGVTDIVLKGICAWALWLVSADSRTAPAAGGGPAAAVGGGVAVGDSVAVDDAVEEPATQPTWPPDMAAGRVWRRAGDAAAGEGSVEIGGSGWATPKRALPPSEGD